MRHPAILRLLQMPLIGSLAIVAAMVVVYPVYWNRVAKANVAPQISTLPPWNDHDRDQARALSAVPSVRLSRIQVGRTSEEELLNGLASPPVQPDVTPADTVIPSELPEGGAITDTVRHLTNEWFVSGLEIFNATFPEGLHWDQPLALAVSSLFQQAPTETLEVTASSPTVETTPILPTADTPTAQVTASDAPPVDASPAVVRLVNDETNQVAVAFLLNGEVKTLKPGETLETVVDANLRFDQGGDRGVRKEILKAGTYRFAVSAADGWTLRQD